MTNLNRLEHISGWSRVSQLKLKTSYTSNEVLGLWPVFAHLSIFGIADVNQERIVEEGGLDALLSLLETSKNTTIHRVTAGAVANLAMNGYWFIVSNKAPFRFLFSLVEMVQKSFTTSLPGFLNYHHLYCKMVVNMCILIITRIPLTREYQIIALLKKYYRWTLSSIIITDGNVLYACEFVKHCISI